MNKTFNQTTLDTDHQKPKQIALDCTQAQASCSIPMNEDLLDAHFTRAGSDLLIYSKTSHAEIIAQNYFTHASLPALISENGQRIAGHSVQTLTQAEEYTQYAGPVEAAAEIGVVEKLEGSVSVKRNGVDIDLKTGDPVYQNDVIHTANESNIGITFNDGSVFTLGSEARMTLDSFVYDPETGDGSSSINVIKGMFKFVSGEIAANNPGEMQVETPVATIGIRGTTGGGSVQGEGLNNQFYLEPNADGTVGWFDVTTSTGTVSMNQPNTVVGLTSFNQAPPAPIFVPATQIRESFSEVINFSPSGKYEKRESADSDAASSQDGDASQAQQAADAADAEAENNNGEADPVDAAGKEPEGGETADTKSEEQQSEGEDVTATPDETLAADADSENPDDAGIEEQAEQTDALGSEGEHFVSEAEMQGDTAKDITEDEGLATDGDNVEKENLSGNTDEVTDSEELSAADEPAAAVDEAQNDTPAAANDLAEANNVAQSGDSTPTADNIPSTDVPSANTTEMTNTQPVAENANTATEASFVAAPPPPPTSGFDSAAQTLAGEFTGLTPKSSTETTATTTSQTTTKTTSTTSITTQSTTEAVKVETTLDTLTQEVDTSRDQLLAQTLANEETKRSEKERTDAENKETEDNGTLADSQADTSSSGILDSLTGNNSNGSTETEEDVTDVTTNDDDKEEEENNTSTDGSTNTSGTQREFTLTSDAESLAGSMQVESYLVNNAAHLTSDDEISAGLGKDILGFEYGATIDTSTPAYSKISGIDVIDVSTAASTITLTDSFVEQSDNDVITVDYGANVATLNLSGISDEGSVLLKGSGTAVFTGSGSHQLSNVAGESVNLDFSTNTVNASVELFGGSNTVSGGMSLNLEQYQGNNHNFALAAGNNYLQLRNTGESTIDGSASDDYFIQAINTTELDVNISTGSSKIGRLIIDDSTNSSFELGGERNYVDITGAHTGLEIDGGGNSASGDAYNLYQFRGDITLNTHDYDTIEVFNNALITASYDLTLNYVGGGSTSNIISAQLFDDASLDLIDSDGDGTIDDLQLSWGANQSISINNLSSSKYTYGTQEIFYNEMGELLTGVARDLSDAQYGDTNRYNAVGDNGTNYTDNIVDTLEGSVFTDFIESGKNNQTVNLYDGNDHAFASHGDVYLNGGGGHDRFTINSSARSATIVGGDDFDIVDFSNITNNLTVGTSASDGTDTYASSISGIEGFITGSGDDSINGGAGDQVLDGGAGSDSLVGGTGIDAASYSRSANGVTVDLNNSSAQSSAGDANGDILSGIENLLGSRQNDDLSGDSNANYLFGNEGDDILLDNQGVDTLAGGEGNDTINLAADFTRDIIQFDHNGGLDTINGFNHTAGVGDVLDIYHLQRFSGGNPDLNYFDLINEERLAQYESGSDLIIKYQDGTGTWHEFVSITGLSPGTTLGWSSFSAGGGSYNIATELADVLITAAATTTNSQGGNDIISTQGVASFTVNAGAGDDTILLEDASATGTLNGQAGYDTVRVMDSSGELNFENTFSSNLTLNSIEEIDLGYSTYENADVTFGNITADAVFGISGNAPLRINGDANDELIIDGSQWQLIETEADYSTYVATTDSDDVAILEINNAITQSAPV